MFFYVLCLFFVSFFASTNKKRLVDNNACFGSKKLIPDQILQAEIYRYNNANATRLQEERQKSNTQANVDDELVRQMRRMDTGRKRNHLR